MVNVVSDLVPVTSGVPQGSLLGPYLFNCYISDLQPLSTQNSFVKYADDNTAIIPLYASPTTHHVELEVDNIRKWASSNKLNINTEKSHALAVMKRQHPPPNTLSLPLVQELKILGVTFNSRLSWETHIKNIVSRASSRLYALRILKPLVSPQNLITIYYSTVRSLLEYCSDLFIGLPGTLASSIDRLQRRAHYITCGTDCTCANFPELRARRLDHGTQLFRKALRDYEHPLHRLLPEPLPSARRLRQPHCATTRRLQSFIPYMTLHANSNNLCI
jgi:hypothetical protein